MSRATIAKHYSRIISQWPKDLIRPEVPFQKVLNARAAKAEILAPEQEAAELRNVNALYSLLDNRYSKKYPLQARMLHPTSHPSYYDDLLVQLKEVPTRTWFQSIVTKFKGMVRLS